MTDIPMIKKIVAMRKRFNEVIVGKPTEKAYAIVAEEFFEDPKTVSYKINLSCYYRKFKAAVEEEEKLKTA